MNELNGTIQASPDGATGCDVNFPISEHFAQAIINTGRTFCIRYIPRAHGSNSGGDLTNAEAALIINAGLALMVVQHVANEGWEPTEELGAAYGSYAATYCKDVVGLPTGVNVWLDLEGVNANAAKADVIAYCKAWYNAVNAAGYVPGVYIGWQVIINNQEAYDLPFCHYWKAYNADVTPATRGYQMIQGTQVPIGGIEVDPNTIKTDNRGTTPVWLISA